MIQKKADKYKALRKRAKNPKTPQALVLEFLKDAESIYTSAQDAGQFYYLLETLSKTLDEQMKFIDRGVKMEIIYNNAKTWSELRITGVRIVWSDFYKAKHSITEDETFMDLTLLLLEDFSEEDEG